MALDYYEYMQSEEWRARRERFLKTHTSCEICGAPHGRFDHVHHKTYERLGAELDEDLQALCRRCHAIVEAQKGNEFWLLISTAAQEHQMPEAEKVDCVPSAYDQKFIRDDESYYLSDPIPGDKTAECDRHAALRRTHEHRR